MVNSPPLYSCYPACHWTVNMSGAQNVDTSYKYIVNSQELYRFYFPVYVHVLRVSAKYLKSNENMTAYDVWGINCHVLKSVKCFKYHKKAFIERCF